jgi:hypothetical protein
MDTTKNNPVAQLRYGSISAAIWRNDSDKGSFYNVTFQRTYKDADQLKNAQSFGRDDLLILAKLADLAHSKIFELQHTAER